LEGKHPLLNNRQTKDVITKEGRKHFEQNNNKSILYQILWATAKARLAFERKKESKVMT
jgi:hypothetical protein